jgi:transposase
MSHKSLFPAVRLPVEKLVRDIRRATRGYHSPEDKIRIVLEGLRGNDRPVAGTLMIVATGSACTLHPRTEAGAAPMASPPAFCPLYRLLNPGAVWFGDPDPMAYE